MEPRLEIGKRSPQLPPPPPPPVVEAPARVPPDDAELKRCLVCGVKIWKEAKKCQPCGTYQDWRVVVPGSSVVLTLLIALFSVLGSVVPQLNNWLHRNSDTAVHIIGGNNQELFIAVTNNGNRPALLRRYEVSFSGIPLASQELALIDPEKSLVMAHDGKLLTLRAGILQPAQGHTREEVEQAIGRGTVTLKTWVTESSDTDINAETAHVDRAPTRQLSEWIEGRMEKKEE